MNFNLLVLLFTFVYYVGALQRRTEVSPIGLDGDSLSDNQATEILRNFTDFFTQCASPASRDVINDLGKQSLISSDLSSSVLYLAAGGVCEGQPRCQPPADRACILRLLLPLNAAADGSRPRSDRVASLEQYLRNVSPKYKPNHYSGPKTNCSNAENILNEFDANQSVSFAYQVLATHFLQGDCVLAADDDHSSGYTWTPRSQIRASQAAFIQLINDVNSISEQCNCKSNRCKRHADHAETQSSKCLNGKQLFAEADTDQSGDLNKDEIFKNVGPQIVEQLVSSVTMSSSDSTGNATDTAYSPNLLAYAYGTIAIAIISLSSVFGLIIIPCLKTRVYGYVMTALIGMGFGILSGDAILHLIPQALGLHAIIHAENDASHSSTTLEIPNYLARSIAILAAVYGLFLFESISSIVRPGHSHDHGHNKEHSDEHKHENNLAISVSSIDIKKNFPQEILEIGDHGLQTSSNSSLYGESSTSGEMAEVELAAEAPVICFELKSLALVITLGDTVHNFADGLVVGAAFAGGLKGGISSALAIFCHEVPHELGDFAILLSTGLSRKKVIIINMLSSLSSFAGLYIGVAIGSDQSAVQWTLAMTAGLFLFVALGDMMPELKNQIAGSPWKRILTQNVAVLTGMAFTVFMAIYEDEIRL